MDKEFIECLKKCDTYEDVVELVGKVIEEEIEISKSNNAKFLTALKYASFAALFDLDVLSTCLIKYLRILLIFVIDIVEIIIYNKR